MVVDYAHEKWEKKFEQMLHMKNGIKRIKAKERIIIFDTESRAKKSYLSVWGMTYK